jgi:uncharacterized protein (DUF433 family)
MKVPEELSAVIVSDPEVMGGTPCFVGTRVPLETFLDHIATGYSLDRFQRGFPSVSRDQALSVLELETRQARIAAGLEIVS